MPQIEIDDHIQFDPTPLIHAVLDEDSENLDPKEPYNLINLARAAIAATSPQSYHDVYAKIDKLPPPLPDDENPQGEAYIKEKIYQTTLSRIEASCTPKFLQSLTPDQTTAINRRREQFEETPSEENLIDYTLFAATILFQKKKHEKAKALLTTNTKDDKHIQKWPNNTKAACLLARIAIRAEDRRLAIQLLTNREEDEQLTPKWPNNSEAADIISINAIKLGQPELALKTLTDESGAPRFPQNKEFIGRLLHTLITLGRHEEITKRHIKEDQINPDYPCTPRIVTGIIIALNAKQKYKKAYRLAQPLIDDPRYERDENLVSRLAFAMSQSGHDEEALQLLRRTTPRKENYPQNFWALASLAHILINQTRLDAAGELSQWIRRERPDILNSPTFKEIANKFKIAHGITPQL